MAGLAGLTPSPMSTLIQSFRATWRSHRMLLVIYLISLVLGLLAALPFYSTLRANTSHSMAYNTLLDAFDFSVFTDFINKESDTIQPLLSVGRWGSLVYLVLSVFFTGGILRRFAEPSRYFQSGAFWQACSHYFRRYLGLLGFTVLLIVLLALIWLVAASLLIMAFVDTSSERGLFWIGFGCFLAFALLATLVLCTGDYAKVYMLRQDESNPLRAFIKSGALVLRHLRLTYGLYGLLLLAGTGWFALYFGIESILGMRNWITILLMFIIQQVFVLGRIGLKVATLGVTWQVYDQLLPPAPVVYPEPVHIDTPPDTATTPDSVQEEPGLSAPGAEDTETQV